MFKLRYWCFFSKMLSLLLLLLVLSLTYAAPKTEELTQFAGVVGRGELSLFPSQTYEDVDNAANAVDDVEAADTILTKGKLIFTNVLYRHGDRMPIEPYPTDPWRNQENWPNGWGQLTNIGKAQHHRLGQWLRQRYDTLISSTYSRDEVFVRSTDVDRTLMSALADLSGLYPPVGNDIWDNDIKWEPIPVHTLPESLDNILSSKKPCPAFEYALSAVKNSPEFQKMYERYAYLFDYLSKYSGFNIDTLEAVQRINNTFFIEELYNKTLPEWTKKVYPSADMTYISSFSFSVNTYTRQLARLKVGLLIKEMLHRFADKVAGKLDPPRSMWIYSAHDTTVANLLNGLKLFDIHSPPYTACVMLELRMSQKNNPFVSIFYKNTTAEPTALNIPGCGTACPLQKMFELYKDILPEDWEGECKLSTLMMTYEEANISMAMGILVAIISVMLFLSYVVMIYYRRRSYRTYFAYTQVA